MYLCVIQLMGTPHTGGRGSTLCTRILELLSSFFFFLKNIIKTVWFFVFKLFVRTFFKHTRISFLFKFNIFCVFHKKSRN